ncbi:hypothetical protein CLOM_g8610, partial [Closterium sp. NIES-68]
LAVSAARFAPRSAANAVHHRAARGGSAFREVSDRLFHARVTPVAVPLLARLGERNLGDMVHQTTALSPHLRLTASFCASRSRRTLLPPPIAGTEWLHAANKGCLIATGADSRIPVSHFQVSGRALHAASDTLLRIRPCAMARGEEGSSKVGAEGGGFNTEPANSREADVRANLSRTASNASSDSGSSSNSSHGRSSLVVISFYKFARLDDFEALKRPLEQVCRDLRVSGGVIVAREGINGSICGTPAAAAAVIDWLRADARLAGLRTTVQPAGAEEREAHRAAEAMEAEEQGEGGGEAEGEGGGEGGAVDGLSECSPLAAGRDAPFRWNHVRVKVKKEIVTLGMPEVNPADGVGAYVSPHEWNHLISDPTTVVVDVRNDYETRIGAFKHAIDPHTRSFRQFPEWVLHHLPLPPSASPHSSPTASPPRPSSASTISPDPSPDASSPAPASPPRVAMYCTGGIRCEKATAYMLHLGFKEVYHLDGGILRYLAEVPPDDSLWEGECFVFDKRVAVGHGLQPTATFRLCYACQQPVDAADMQSPLWEEGVSCPHCHASKSAEEKERARARQQQFQRWGAVGGPGGEKAERAAERMRRRVERRRGGEKSVV